MCNYDIKVKYMDGIFSNDEKNDFFNIVSDINVMKFIGN